MAEPIDDQTSTPIDEQTPTPLAPATTVRSWGSTIAVGVAVGLAAIATVYVLVAMPLYFLSSLEPNGRDRPFVRNGLLVYGPALSVLIGLAIGVAGGRWYRSGQTWAVRTSDSPTTRR